MSELCQNAGCPKCDGYELIQYNWKLALKRDGGKFDKYRDYLSLEQHLKSGSLYICSICGARWYLDRAQEMMTFILEDELSFVLDWNSRILQLPSELLSVARKIGFSRLPILAGGDRAICLPCKIISKSGDIFELAMIVFQDNPPLRVWKWSVRLFDDVAQIQPSKFALSRSVRRAAAAAREIRMNFAPTVVESPEGRFFVLNGAQNFFVMDNVEASSLVLSTRRPKKTWPIYEQIHKITYFVGDWRPEVEALLTS